MLQAVLLQNTRMHAGDTANDPQFAAQLARLADVYVCDAFGVIHRDQASVTVSEKLTAKPLVHRTHNVTTRNGCDMPSL